MVTWREGDMKLRNRLLTFGGLIMLMSLAACAAPAEPVVTPEPTSEPTSEAPAVTVPGGEATESQPLSESPVEQTSVASLPSAVTGPHPSIPLMVSNDGDVVTIPLSAIEDVVNTEFAIAVDERSLDFMAYVLDGELYVRASACPPCATLEYALDAGTLLCGACDTSFDASTGAGIDGACVDYPKAAVAYEVSGGVVTLKVADLVRAWDETEAAGDGPVVAPIIVAAEPEAEPTRPSCCG
jgi:nitrite reductase/ring-hydroxylating ferredoxin subunit